jgi:hypothetical protein
MDSCPICYEQFKPADTIVIIKHQNDGNIEMSRKRGHYFHRNCIETWKREGNEVCPMDRDVIGRLYTIPGYQIIKFDLQDYDNDYNNVLSRYQINSRLLDIIDDINQCDKNGRTLAYYACRFGNYGLVSGLLRRNADFNYPCGYSRFTPLMCAVCYNHFSIVHKLLMTPAVIAGINYQDRSGNTAFQYACRYGHVAIINDFFVLRLTSCEEVKYMYGVMYEKYRTGKILFGDEIIAKMLNYLKI